MKKDDILTLQVLGDAVNGKKKTMQHIQIVKINNVPIYS